ncbi:unnamed protein product [Diplocarpon coronariae]
MHPTSFVIMLVALTATTVHSHMEMKFPSPLGARPIDTNLHAPLEKDGSNFPCHGHLNLAGKSVITWPAGSEAHIIVGGVLDPAKGDTKPAFHNGGSCQAALSYDSGKTWKVIHSYQGGCPIEGDTTLNFKIPSDAASGDALFAWLWWNHTGTLIGPKYEEIINLNQGQREMYMNCASVTIAAGSGPAPAVPFSQRPDIFRANIGNGCATVEDKDTFFPNPGPEVDVTTVRTKQEGSYVGMCGTAGAPSSSKSASNPTPAQNQIQNAAVGRVAPHGASVVIDILPTRTKKPSSPSSAAPCGSLKVSSNGECSGSQTCSGSNWGRCCSEWGYCGSKAAYCQKGCQPGFGACDTPALIRGRQVWKS